MVIGLLATWLTLSAAAPAAAAPLQIVSGGKLMGATGVDVNGTLYDVQFLDGTCATVFTGCDTLSDFDFQTTADGQAAAAALLAQVLIDTALGTFDSDPELTNGCTNTGLCILAIPVAFAPFGFLGEPGITGPTANNESLPPDGVGLLSAKLDADLSEASFAAWAKFTPAAATPVPEPGSLLLFATGGAALLTKLRRRRKPKA